MRDVRCPTRRRIAEAVQDGVGLEVIDRELISPQALGSEGRAALWLFAWGLTERPGDEQADDVAARLLH